MTNKSETVELEVVTTEETTEPKMTKGDLINIADALSYLATKETDAWYQVGKNMNKLKKFAKEVQAERELITKNLSKKDEHGRPVYKDREDGGKEVVWRDEKADQEQRELWKKFTSEDAPEIEFHKFSMELLEDTKLSGGLLASLIDVVIID